MLVGARRSRTRALADPKLAAVFRRPFAEALAALRLRLGNRVPTTKWDDITRAAHDRSFMVAGAIKADLLADLALAVDKIEAEGISLEKFRKDWRGIVAKHGWHGWTGEGTKKGEAWRTRVIYTTNMSVSYAAGRYAQLKEGNFAYWIYFHGNSLEPRPVHLSWDGLALPPDHPFWATHYPPNDWGCSCYVIGTNSLAGVKRLGGDPEKQLPANWQASDPRTGAPVGIGKGWDYAPGASVAETITALRSKLDQLPERPSIDLIQSWLKSEAFAEWYANPVGNWPLVRIPALDAKLIGATRLTADLSPETVNKQLRKHLELSTREYALAQGVIDNPSIVAREGEHNLIYVAETPEDQTQGGWVIVVKATMTGNGLFVTSFRRFSREEADRAQAIKRLLTFATIIRSAKE